jgi:hypothetical protein
MHLIIVHLAPTLGAPQRHADANAAVTEIWSRVGPCDAPEHLSARRSPVGLHLGFFYRTDTYEHAKECAYELTRRVVESAPALASWRIEPREQDDLDV